MKKLAAALFVAAIASAAHAQINTPTVNKPLNFAQAKPPPATAAKRKLEDGTATKDKTAHCDNPAYDVREKGELIGCDPDPTVRLMLRQEFRDRGGMGNK